VGEGGELKAPGSSFCHLQALLLLRPTPSRSSSRVDPAPHRTTADLLL
jgi:hypothetical protein